MNFDTFKTLIWEYYKSHKRIFPWRQTTEPYHIFMSEIMLQQTQVSRILRKYEPFLKTFPSFQSLAHASLGEVLKEWSGIGYNRRVLYLKTSAEMVVENYKGLLPSDPLQLQSLPGVGYATACAIVTYSFNIPTVFIETNIRRTFIHHFFQDREGISDKDIYPLVEQTVDKQNSRKWYWALMDYGTYLAKAIPNPNKKSKHYAVQSKFEGSNRQLRGKILRLLGENKFLSKERLYKLLDNDPRSAKIVKALSAEGFIVEKNNIFSIK